MQGDNGKNGFPGGLDLVVLYAFGSMKKMFQRVSITGSKTPTVPANYEAELRTRRRWCLSLRLHPVQHIVISAVFLTWIATLQQCPISMLQFPEIVCRMRGTSFQGSSCLEDIIKLSFHKRRYLTTQGDPVFLKNARYLSGSGRLLIKRVFLKRFGAAIPMGLVLNRDWVESTIYFFLNE